MSVTTGELIQLLQLIVLAFTAVVFIAQFVLRFFVNEDMTGTIKSVKGEKAMNKLTNGVQMFFLSIAFFMIGGTVVSLYLVLVGAPAAVGQFMSVFEANILLFGGVVLVAVGALAMYIQGDYENPHSGMKGIVVAAVLTGGVSIIIITIYVTLWAATRSVEWIFFIGSLSVAFAMFALLFGALALSEVLMEVVEEVTESVETE